MKLTLTHNYIFILITLLVGVTPNLTAQPDQSPVDYVNPFIGTAPLTNPEEIGYNPPRGWRVWAGLTYPGTTLPNAMVQVSPITEYGSGAGYEYEDKEILGFTHTNKGHWNLCNIPILPVSGADLSIEENRKSSFSHTKEKASPGFYQVYLDDYDIDVELTSTLRCGYHQYTFKNNDKRILFDLSKANHRVHEWDIHQKDDYSLTGYQDMGRERIHFYVTMSEKITDLHITQGHDGFAVVQLSGKSATPVQLAIGLSYVSAANAKENVEKEIGEKTFDQIHQQARKKWSGLLGKITVKGGTQKEKELFYTSFYRTFLWPALRSDYNGEFVDENGDVRNRGFRYYRTPSLWDTYRNKLVLLGLFQPEVTNDVIKSLLDRGEITGFIPTFFHGDHAAPFITGMAARNIGNFNKKQAYQLLLNNAYKEGGTRPYITEYIEKGYVSDPDVTDAHVETKGKAGVSKTLEFSYDDYALSLLAKQLNDKKHYEDLVKRANNYENVFDKSTNFMRGKLKNGEWISPFNPQYPYYEYMYREANAWQVSFFVPHDMPGLIELYGGKDVFEKKLDSLFSLPWNPDYIARNISGFKGQYAQGNQPDHEAPYAYYFIDKPYKSQEVIDDLLANYYGIGDHSLALSGMDDAGEMSSWYVCAAAGFYPYSPADPEYLITVPIFDKVHLNVAGDEELVIEKKGSGRQLKNMTINGRKLSGYTLSHEQLMAGGTLRINTKQIIN